MYGSKQATAYTSGATINRARKKTKGTNSMWKWFIKKVRYALQEVDQPAECYEVSSRGGLISNDRCSDERITLRLDKAIGGHIVSVSKYNSKVDRHRDNTYIIRDDDNLEEALTAVFIQEKISQ